ncbi:MAG: hypothetical protein Q8910_01205 [Bacteroidota bacterium]|nr:hypothetical protein [Bacteroidota bacterium]
MTEENSKIDKSYGLFLLINFCAVLICLGIYMSYVSLTETPLLLFLQQEKNVDALVMARENTLVTLSLFPKYSYSFLRSIFTPFVVGFGSYAFFLFWKEKKYILAVLCFSIVFASILSSSIVLNKSVISILMILIILNFIWKNVVNLQKMILFGSIGIFISFIIALFVSGFIYGTYDSLSSVSLMPVLNRAFLMPFKVGTWYIHYAQTEGILGLSAFPKIAAVFGNLSIYPPEMIGKIYSPIYYNQPVMATHGANASFIFVNYLAFGVMGLPLTVLMVLLLDLALIPMQWLSKNFLIPFLSIIAIHHLNFLSSDFGVSLITHGYLISILVMGIYCYTLSKLLARSRFSSLEF